MIKLSELPSGIMNTQIQDIISSFGECSFSIQKKSDASSSTCIITFANRQSADDALEGLEGKDICGKKLVVSRYETASKNGPRILKSNQRNQQAQQLRNIDFPLRILVQSEMVGAIIGRAGQTIRNITQQTRARVDVHRKENVGSVEKAITIYGQPENLTKACHLILKVMEEEAKNTGKSEEIFLKMLAHNNLIGRIIGKNGATINKIMENTNTKITVSSIHDINSFNMERIISIKGSIDDISRAEANVSSKLRTAYESDINAITPQNVMFPGVHPANMLGINSSQPRLPLLRSDQAYMGLHFPFSTNISLGNGLMGVENNTETTYLYIPNSCVGAVIGMKGTYIRNIIKYSGATVRIAPILEGTELDSNSRKVTIVGVPEAQWKAQYLIYEALRKETSNGSGLSEVQLHAEIRVPSSQVGRIIGKGGANVREMQRLTGAIVKLPEQGTGTGQDETPVQIMGTFFSVQSGQRRIRSMIHPSTYSSSVNGDSVEIPQE